MIACWTSLRIHSNLLKESRLTTALFSFAWVWNMHFSAISSAFLPQISTAAPSGTENFHQRHRGSRFVGLYWTQLDYIGRYWTEMEKYNGMKWYTKEWFASGVEPHSLRRRAVPSIALKDVLIWRINKRLGKWLKESWNLKTWRNCGLSIKNGKWCLRKHWQNTWVSVNQPLTTILGIVV